MESRKQKEAEFHNKLRDEKLKDEEAEYKRMTLNKRFYSIAKGNRVFIEQWLLQRCSNKRILDYCCGNGEFSIFLARNGAKAVGIDISEKGIEKAKREAANNGIDKNISFLLMDAEDLKFNDNSFDIIICSGVLHHLDIKRAYPELMRVLKPNGEIICNEPLVYNPIFQFYRRMTPHLRTRWEMEHILTKKDIELAKKYFDKVEIKFFHLATLMAVPFRNLSVFNSILRPLERVDSVLLRLPILRWLAWQTVFILSKPKKQC